MSILGVGGTQAVNSSSSSTPLEEMSIEQLLIYVVFQRMDVNALQLRQHASEMDARTQKLEMLGKMSQALGKIASQYGTDATQELKNTDVGKKMSKSDWAAIQSDTLSPEEKKAQLDKMAAAIDTIDGKFSGSDPAQKIRETDYGKKYSNSQWDAAGPEFKKVFVDKTQDKIQNSDWVSADKRAEHKEVRDSSAEIARIGKEMGLLSDDDVTRIGNGTYTRGELQALKAKIQDRLDGAVATSSQPVSDAGKNADEKARAQDLKDGMEELIKYGRETGLLTESDISRLSKGEFKKSEIESLQASIKTEQDKIGNENQKQQLTLQSLTGRMESITNLAGTLTKIFNEILKAIIQKT